MTILYWFLAVNLLIVLTALAVKAFRRRPRGGLTKNTTAAISVGGPLNRQWTVQNNVLGIVNGCDNLRDFLESREVPIKDLFDLSAILEEMLSYVLSNEFPERNNREILIGAKIEKGAICLELRYEGKGYNPLEAPQLDLTKPLEEITLDGMDIHLLRHWTDRLDYRRDGSQCIFTAVKNVTSDNIKV
jgi:serine/threonine-protein kinase RsbW